MTAFSSWQAFWAMGGYAFYVWLAVACTLVALGGLVLHTILIHRRLLTDIRQRESRERRIKAAKIRKQGAAQ